MDTTSQQPNKKQEYQTLGKKVFWLFFLQLSPISLILLLISIVTFILSFQPFLANTPAGNIQKYALLATLATFVAAIVVAAISFASAWLTYKNYLFSLSEDSFKIKRGVLSKTENAIPYRQIQNVDIERDFMFQILGLSRVIILTAGHEDASPGNSKEHPNEAEGVIPAVDKNIGEWLQTELLRRADIQKTVQVSGN